MLHVMHVMTPDPLKKFRSRSGSTPWVGNGNGKCQPLHADLKTTVYHSHLRQGKVVCDTALRFEHASLFDLSPSLPSTVITERGSSCYFSYVTKNCRLSHLRTSLRGKEGSKAARPFHLGTLDRRGTYG